MRLNIPRLRFLSASLPILILSMTLVAEPVSARGDGDPIQHQPDKPVQKPRSMSVYSKTPSNQDHSRTTAKPHSLLQKRVKPEAQAESVSPMTPAHENNHARQTPSPVPLTAPLTVTPDTRAFAPTAILQTSPTAATAPLQSRSAIASPAKAANVEASAPRQAPRNVEAHASRQVPQAAAATVATNSPGVTDEPAPVGRLIFRRAKLQEEFKPTHPPEPPAIGASPLSFSFTAQQGGTNPAVQTLAIHNVGGDALTWITSHSATWLTLSPASGTNHGTVILSVDISALTPGPYTDTITVSATDAAPVIIPVTLTITPSTPSLISLSPTSLTFTATQGAANPGSQTLSVRNTGGGTLTWSASENQGWLSLSPASGTTTTETDSITVSVNISGLQANTYSASITVTATGATNTPQVIPVTLTVNTPAAAMSLSPTSLTFTATQGTANVGQQTILLRNTGGGTLTWTVTDNQSWLSVSPASGTTTTETDPITVSVNIAGLQADTYSASITVTGTGASNTSQVIPVTLTVTALPPAIGTTSNSVALTAQQNSSTSVSQAITISNTGGGTLTWTASESAAWLSLSPASGTNTGTLTFTAAAGSLTSGTHNTSVTISAPNATAKTIAVAFTVAPPQSATLTWTENAETDIAGYKVYRATSTGAYGAPIATLGKTTNYTMTNLSINTTYYFVITAYDSAGNESTYSNEVSKSIY